MEEYYFICNNIILTRRPDLLLFAVTPDASIKSIASENNSNQHHDNHDTSTIERLVNNITLWATSCWRTFKMQQAPENDGFR